MTQSTDDLVERLREPSDGVVNMVTVKRRSTGETIETFDPLKREAANALEKLEHEVVELKVANSFLAKANADSADTIERLQRELAESHLQEISTVGQLQQALEARDSALDRANVAEADLAARDKTIETLREDAERYRWLRDQQYNDDVDLRFADYNEDGPTDTWYSLWGAELDAAIDAARKDAARSEVKP